MKGGVSRECPLEYQPMAEPVVLDSLRPRPFRELNGCPDCRQPRPFAFPARGPGRVGAARFPWRFYLDAGRR